MTPAVKTLNKSDLNRWHAYVLDQLEEQRRLTVRHPERPVGPAITFSYETGSGARDIAHQVASLLEAAKPPAQGRWKVFDRQLVEQVIEEHHLPKRLAKFMIEDRRSYLDDVLDELAGLRPPSWVLVPKIVETIQHLVETGHVILLGRGANLVTAETPNVFHVRLVGSLPNRIKRVQDAEQLSPEAAAKFVARSDRGRWRFAKAYFHGELKDDLQYHIVLNTDRVPLSQAAELIAIAAQKCFVSSVA